MNMRDQLIEGVNKLGSGVLEGRSLNATKGWVANLIKTLSVESPDTLKDTEVRVALKGVESQLDNETRAILNNLDGIADSTSNSAPKKRGRKPQVEGQISERQAILAFIVGSDHPVSTNEVKQAFPNVNYPSSHLNNLKACDKIKHSKDIGLYWCPEWDGRSTQ